MLKCPGCGNADKLSHLGPVEGQPGQDGYRCAQCGRLFVASPEGDSHGSTSPMVVVEKSGIGTLITLAERSTCEELRAWLKDQPYRVGTTFEPVSGVFAFYVYKRPDTVAATIGRHGNFMVERAPAVARRSS